MDWTRFFRRISKPLPPTRPCLELLEDRIVPSGPVLTLPGSQSDSEGQSVTIFASATNPNNLTLTYSASTLPAGLSINTTSGLISGIVAYNNSSAGLTATLVAFISVTDGTAGDSGSLSWLVADTDRIGPASQTSNEGFVTGLSLMVNDVTGTNSLTYSASALPAGLTINTASGFIGGTIAYSAVNGAATSLYTPTVTLTDNHGGTDTRVVSWTVTDTNRLPFLGPASFTEGQNVGVNEQGTDVFPSDTLTYSASNLPPGLTINAASGFLSGFIAYSAVNGAATSLYTPTVTLTDNHGGTDTRTVSWTISDANRLSTIISQSGIEGQPASLSIHASDPFVTDTLTYSVSNLPPGLSVNASTGLISGTVAYNAASTGVTVTFSPTVTLTDNHGGTDTRGFSWTVTDTNRLPSLISQSGIEGQLVSLNAQGTDGISGDTLTYSVSGLPGGLTINASTGLISGTVAYNAASTGVTVTFSPTVTLTDNHGGSDTRAFSWTVTDTNRLPSPINQSNHEGQLVSLNMQGTDAISSDTLTYSVSGLPGGLTINASTGLIGSTVGYHDAAVGSTSVYAATVTLTDNHGGTDTRLLSWTVSGTWAITLTSLIIDQFNIEGNTVSLPAAATDSTSGATLTYSASGLPTGLTLNPSTGLISGTVTTGAGNLGAHAVSLTMTDGSSSNGESLTWTVASSIALTNPGPQTNPEGATVSLAIAATDSGSAALTYEASNLPMGLVISPTSGLISGIVALGAAASGPYRTSLMVTNGGFVASTLFTWNVASPVTLTNPGSKSSVEGSTVSLSLSASDSISGSTLTYSGSGLPNGLKINTSTGAITGTVALNAAANGPYNVTLTAADGTYSAFQTLTWTVTVPITMTNPGDQTSTEGNTVSLSITASDTVSGSTLAYVATGLPDGLKINTSSGLITGTVAVGAGQVGPYTTTVEAGDSTYSASQTFTWNVSSPVAIKVPADQASGEGATPTLTVTASDSRSGTTLVYGATGLPKGLSLNSSTGVITGTVASGDAGSGPYAVTLLTSDGTYSDQENFNWTVSNAITLTAPTDQANTEGDTVSLAVAASDATSGATLTYTASALPSGLSINASTGVITGTISAGGPWQPTVTAKDGTATVSQAFNWAVSGPITVTDPGTQADNAGETVSLQVQASDTATGTLTYSVSGLPSGLSLNTTSGLISGTLASTLSAGVSLSTLTVVDGTNTAKQPLAWVVLPASQVAVTNPGTLSTSEGAGVTQSIGDTYSGTGTVVYSAEGLPMGLKINTSTGVITGTVSGGDSGFGPFDPTVTATDGTSTDTQTFTWNVSSAVALTAPADQTSTEGATVTLSLSASYSGTASLTYSGLDLPSGLAVNPSTGVITGTVAANDAASGPYSVTVIAAAGASSNSQTFTWTVNSPITITALADQTSTEGGTVSLTLSTTDSVGGSTLHYAADSLPFGLKINPSTGTITGTVAVGAAADGPYFVTVLAEDGTYSTTQTFNWTVSSPVTLTVPADQTNNEGSAVTLTLSATDSVSGSTLWYAVQGLPAGLKINPSTGVITGTLAAGDSVNGPYAVTIQANDGTYTTTQAFNWNVNSPVAETLPNDQSNHQGDTVSLAIQTSDAVSGATLTYSATGLPNGATLNASTGLITGTLSAGGFWEPTVTVSDGTYTSTQTFAWSVSSPVSITDPGFQSNTEGNTLSLAVTATDTATGTLTFTASGLPTGLSINASTGLITGTVSSGDSASSPYFPTITASDGTNTAVDSLEWDIGSSATVVITSPGSQTNMAGDGVFLPLQASDSSGGTLMYTVSGLPGGLTINPITGQVLGTVASNANSGSPYSVTISATDGTNSGSLTFSWTINAAGTVTLANPGDQTNNEGDSVSVSLNATGTVDYAAFGLPAGLKLNPSTGAITGSVALGDAAYGPYTVTVVANDGTHSAQQTFLWNVNSPISLTAPSDQTNNEGDSATLTLSASDGSGTLTYAALGLPPGLKINPSTGTITGTVAKGATQQGPYWVTIYAEDGTYSTEQTFNWTVNSPVADTIPADQTNNEGDSVTLSLSATDAISGSTLHYMVLGLPAGLSINASTGTISGTVALGSSAIGWFEPTIIATDGSYLDAETFNWYINGAVTITSPSDEANVVGDVVSLQLAASDSTNGTLVYTADGLPIGLSLNTGTGLISGTISASAAAIGSFTTTVTAGDGSSTATATFNWTVSGTGTVTLATPSNQSSTEGNTASLSLSATDSGSSTLHYFAQGLPGGLSLNPATGSITGTVALGAAGYGPYMVVVTATDGTNSAQETFTWTVSSPVTITLSSNQTNNESDTVSLAISASDPSGTLKYGAVGLPAGLKINTSTGAITGTVALGAGAIGQYLVTLMAGDSTYSRSQTFTWSIGNPITLTAPSGQTNYEGATVTLSFSASDSSGGTLTYSAVGLPAGLKINTSTGAITGTVAVGTAANEPYSVQVTASDGTYSSNQTFTWTISNPISIWKPGALKYSEGTSVTLSISASDYYNMSLTYSASGLPRDLSINSSTGVISGVIRDGVADDGAIVATIKASDGTYSASQTVTWTIQAPAEGFYTVAVVATDKGIVFINTPATPEEIKALYEVKPNDPTAKEIVDKWVNSPTAIDLVSPKIAEGTLLLQWHMVQAAKKLSAANSEYLTDGNIAALSKGEVSNFWMESSIQDKTVLKLKPGSNPQSAMAEFFTPKTAKNYTYDCASAVTICALEAQVEYAQSIKREVINAWPFVIAGNAPVSKGLFDSRMPKGLDSYKAEDVVKNSKDILSVLVPGEMLYIKNPNAKLTHDEGENVIYLGNGQFFGMRTDLKKRIMTLPDWITFMASLQKKPVDVSSISFQPSVIWPKIPIFK